MKNLFKLFGIVALAAIVVFSVMSCDELLGEEGDNKFVGKWIGTITKDTNTDDNATIEITESKWTVTSSISTINGQTGTCEFGSVQAKFKNADGFTLATATVGLGQLILTGSSDSGAFKGASGTFKKETSQAGNKFIGEWEGSFSTFKEGTDGKLEVDKEADDAVIKFTEKEWTLSSAKTSTINKSGTYKYNTLFGTAALKAGSESYGTGTILFDTLTISAGDNGTGTFIGKGKKPDTSVTGTWKGKITKGGNDTGIEATLELKADNAYTFNAGSGTGAINSSGTYTSGSFSYTLKTTDGFTFGTFTVLAGKLTFTGSTNGPAKGYSGSLTKNP